jgi:RimJ/RimL family protein N-acetyltransferase
MHAWRPTILTRATPSLVGEHVILVPLSRGDLPELERVPDDPAFDLLLRPPVGRDTDARAWLDDALRCVRRGGERCWTIRDRLDGRLLGSTRFLNVDLAHRRLEVGATWLLAEARGTAANAESKLLLLDHAFLALGVERVHIQADVENARSRRAIESLGATFEGVLRRHRVRRDGTSQDTAVYSIIAGEWPELRAGILARAARSGPGWRVRALSLLPNAAAGDATAITA